MASTDAYALQRSDLNGFLFADVGVEANGTTLSVLSTLARLGMDPWQEAGRLAKLPRTAAVDELARIIATMPASLWSLADATAIAARLVALLPVGGGGLSVTSATQHVDAATIATRLLALLPARGGPSIAPAAQSAPPASQTTRRWSVVLALLGIVLAGLALNSTGQRGAASDSDAATRRAASQPASPATPPLGHTPTGE